MQTDMHYYGTYALARAAGLIPDVAWIIATAAEFVDDSNEVQMTLSDGCFLQAKATAHHSENIKNIDKLDQREIWVPFHFLPGNQGESYEERLVCVTDSAIAQEMVQHNLENPDNAPAIELIGITAHVYADTFAHYGISGISSRLNRVDRATLR